MSTQKLKWNLLGRKRLLFQDLKQHRKLCWRKDLSDQDRMQKQQVHTEKLFRRLALHLRHHKEQLVVLWILLYHCLALEVKTLLLPLLQNRQINLLEQVAGCEDFLLDQKLSSLLTIPSQIHRS